MAKPRGYFAPGSRRRRWRQNHDQQGVAMLLLAILPSYAALTHGGPWEGTVFLFFWAGALVWGAFASFRSANRGWELDYSIPDHAWQRAQKDDWDGHIARETIKKMEELKRNPNRKRYAFDDGD